MSEQTSSRSLASSGAIMAAGTMLSRVLGFGRAVLIALVLGNGTKQVEMFTLANTIPTSLYILFAGGALNTVLVPQIVRATERDADRGEAYTNRIMTAFLALIAAVTVVLVLIAPVVLRIYTDSTWRGPELAGQYESMLTLTYLCLPQVFFYGAFFLAGQVLNARGRFGPMMWAPIVNNLVSMAVFVLYLVLYGTGGDRGLPFDLGQELVLGIGATAGIVVQAGILLPFLRRAGFVYRPRFDLRGTGLGHTFSLAKWTLGFVAITQLALVAVNRLASSATTQAESGAGITAYNSAYLIWILPHSVITVSLATAMVTSASQRAAAGDLRGVARETSSTWRLATTVVLPASVAFLVLADPITRLAFGYGVGATDYRLVASTLVAFAVGLVPFTVHYICLRAFYALEDTRTPFLLQALIAGLNAGLAVLFVTVIDDPRLIAAALGLAYSLAYLVGVLIAFARLRGRLPDLSPRPLVRHLARVLLAVLPAAVLAWLITWGFTRIGDGRLISAAGLVVAGLVAVGCYVVTARLLHLREMDDIVSTVLRRGRGARSEAVEPPAEDGRGGPSAVPANEDEQASTPVTPAGADPLAATASPPIANEAGERTGPDAPAPDAPAHGAPTPTDPPPSSTDPDVLASARQRAGDVLGRRYRLEEVLAGRADTHTWRAFDRVLSRSVLLQVLPPDDPRSPALLEAARASAVATDSRFLRVLDAVPSDDPEVGSYIVTEYSPGQTLEVMLAQGPLSALEAAWLVREAADALTAMHGLGLHHGHLGPDAITITPAGNLKITGFLLDSAIVPEPGRRSGSDAGEPGPEAQDVTDLGRLLYAALVSRWPGGARYGLDAAPTDAGRLLTPRQVRHGVSPALDRITDQILSDVPRHQERPLTTVAEVATALSGVLGSADASHDLERRVRQPVPVVGGSGPATEAVPVVEATSPRSPASSSSPSAVDARVEPSGVRVVETSAPPRRRWLAVLLLLLVLALVGGLVGVVVRNQVQFTGNAPDPGETPPAGPITVSEVIVFDPEGDPPGEENNATADLAVDGDPETGWQTVYYRGDPRLGGLKRGVGLVLDLGERRDVTEVSVLLPERPSAVEVSVPDDLEAAEPPIGSDEAWDVRAENAEATGEVRLALDETVSTRFVLVNLTSLPPDGGSFRGTIFEVQVTG